MDNTAIADDIRNFFDAIYSSTPEPAGSGAPNPCRTGKEFIKQSEKY